MKKPKRILHIIGRMDRAGAETMLINLYRVLNKEEYQFDFLYFTDDKCHYDDEITRMGGKIYRIPIEKYSNPIYRTYKLFNLLRSNKSFYAIHTHTLFSNGLNLLAARLAGYKKRVVHSHSTNDINSQTFSGRLYQSFSKFLINHFATDFVACGIDAANYLFYKSKKVFLLPNAVDVERFNNTIKDDFLRNGYQLKKDTAILLQIGRLSKVKNFDFTLKIAQKLKNKNFPFHLFIVGDGVLKKNIEKQIIENDLTRNVTMLGIRKDIPKLLKNSDLLLMPSLYEGFPVVLVESQASGIPALISDNISKEVDIGVSKIFYITLDDIDKWINAILNHHNLTDMDDNIRIEILKKKGFDINESVKILYKIYS